MLIRLSPVAKLVSQLPLSGPAPGYCRKGELDILLMEMAVFFLAEVRVFQRVGIGDVDALSWNKLVVFMCCVWPQMKECS